MPHAEHLDVRLQVRHLPLLPLQLLESSLLVVEVAAQLVLLGAQCLPRLLRSGQVDGLQLPHATHRLLRPVQLARQLALLPDLLITLLRPHAALVLVPLLLLTHVLDLHLAALLPAHAALALGGRVVHHVRHEGGEEGVTALPRLARLVDLAVRLRRTRREVEAWREPHGVALAHLVLLLLLLCLLPIHLLALTEDLALLLT
mmetsp:Transcript_17905/g.42481  ORF Transcript_17905/g.42481 Transcript_17905/m.42481 type:complete len:202 (+) Transcript_17905:1827-2432(+)